MRAHRHQRADELDDEAPGLAPDQRVAPRVGMTMLTVSSGSISRTTRYVPGCGPSSPAADPPAAPGALHGLQPGLPGVRLRLAVPARSSPRSRASGRAPPGGARSCRACSVTRSTRSWSWDPSMPTTNPPTSRTSEVAQHREVARVHLADAAARGDHSGLRRRRRGRRRRRSCPRPCRRSPRRAARSALPPPRRAHPAPACRRGRAAPRTRPSPAGAHRSTRRRCRRCSDRVCTTIRLSSAASSRSVVATAGDGEQSFTRISSQCG